MRGRISASARLLLAVSALALAVLSVAVAQAAPAPAYSLAVVGAYGGEPSILSDHKGVLYYTTPSSATIGGKRVVPIYRSTNKGKTWTPIQPADFPSGDDCLGVDEANDLYWCNLQIQTTQGIAPLQADDWRSTVAGTCTANCQWVHGAGAIPGVCSTSCSVFGVDRQWTAATIPPGKSPDSAEVVLMYHDFYGPSQIWVNISQDGGKTFGPPVEVLASPAVTPGAIAGTVVAEGYTLCNTVPAGVTIVPPGKPHAGRIIVGWIAADLAQNATGCNLTMLQAFHTAWVSYSDDNGVTWTPQQVIDMGLGHDLSTPFVGMTADSDGNPYLAFSSQPMSQNPLTCAAESTAGTVQGDTSCQYNMYVAWSKDGGATWNDGAGLIPGSASAPIQVSLPSETGTHIYPAIAAGKPGQVAVGYLYSPTIVPTDPLGKFDPGGCAGPVAGNLPTYPPTCDWYLEAGQTFNVGAAHPSWQTLRITSHPMHYGDICNLGIFCVDPNSNRNLLDFIQATLDPTTGCAHIAYPDDNAGAAADPHNPSPYGDHLLAANQTAGCLDAFAVKAAATTLPPTLSSGSALPLAAWLVLLGGIVLLACGLAVSRRLRPVR
jgi:hypothetical protein